VNRTLVRRDLLRMYRAAIATVSGTLAVSEYLARNPLSGSYHLAAIGKAASAMSVGALKVMGAQIVDGIVITKHGHLEQALLNDSRLLCLEADHPVPGESSLRAGRALVDFVEHSPTAARFLFLISGGASSLVEVLPSSIDLSDLRVLNDTLLSGGWDIGEINRARKAVSLIKGGGMLNYLGNREAKALLISDVPGDDPGVIGSGLLVLDTEQAPLPRLPDASVKLLEGRVFSSRGEASFSQARVSIEIIATLEDAKQAAARRAKELGYSVTIHHDFVQGDVEKAAASIAESLRRAAPGVHIWGGETSVNLPAAPGRGGRNQHLALALALLLRGETGIYVLTAGTDGTDGPTYDAGGLVDFATIGRGESSGVNASICLEEADAGRFLQASGDLLNTGPTGTNVMDIMIGYKQGIAG
jgi:glycerate 2-kinase